jgi:hypothetical protein
MCNKNLQQVSDSFVSTELRHLLRQRWGNSLTGDRSTAIGRRCPLDRFWAIMLNLGPQSHSSSTNSCLQLCLLSSTPQTGLAYFSPLCSFTCEKRAFGPVFFYGLVLFFCSPNGFPLLWIFVSVFQISLFLTTIYSLPLHIFYKCMHFFEI